jgi:hypothetical protein
LSAVIVARVLWCRAAPFLAERRRWCCAPPTSRLPFTTARPAAGADRLKEALAALGLKCGGTTRQRAERLYAAKGKRLDELDPKLFAKGSALSAARDEPALAKRREAAWEACALEGKVGGGRARQCPHVCRPVTLFPT